MFAKTFKFFLDNMYNFQQKNEDNNKCEAIIIISFSTDKQATGGSITIFITIITFFKIFVSIVHKKACVIKTWYKTVKYSPLASVFTHLLSFQLLNVPKKNVFTRVFSRVCVTKIDNYLSYFFIWDESKDGLYEVWKINDNHHK